MVEIIVSIVTGVLTLVGVCVTAWASNRKTGADVSAKLEVAQAVTDTKIEALTDEVKKHNGFAMRVPVLEVQVAEINHRLDNLEDTAHHGGK